MYGVSWTDEARTDPCYPKVNKLREYAHRSRIDGIWEAYGDACDEIIQIYNDQQKKISELNAQILKFEQTAEAENTVNAATEKSQEQRKPMQGRKPKLLTEEETAKAVRMRNAGMTYQKIASSLGVSERTIRRAVATDPDPVK